jgi:hypothetical protein
MVFRAAQRFDPFSRTPMALGSARAWDLAVGDVAKQLVAERVLGVTSDGRSARPLNEVPAHERRQQLVGIDARDAADRLERADPEDVADDSGILQQPLLDVGQPVQARRDDAVQALRQFLEPPVLDQYSTELLRVERVAADASEQGLVRLGRKHRLLQHRSDQPCGLVVGQGR